MCSLVRHTIPASYSVMSNEDYDDDKDDNDEMVVDVTDEVLARREKTKRKKRGGDGDCSPVVSLRRKALPRRVTPTHAARKRPNRNKDEEDEYGRKNDNDDDDVVDVTDEMMRRERKRAKQMKASATMLSDDDDESASSYESDGDTESDGGKDCSDDDDGDDDDDDEDNNGDDSYYEDRKCRPTRRVQRKESPQTASRVESSVEVLLEEQDVPEAPGTPAASSGKDWNKTAVLVGKAEEDAVKTRIRKLLNTGFHSSSNENEAKTALKLARRLMTRHNLSQAKLWNETKENEQEACHLRGGMVQVHLVHRATQQPLGNLPRWLRQLIFPATENFHVQAYRSLKRGKRGKGKCSIVFYGVLTNVELAAYAYKVAAEKIGSMMASYRRPFAKKTRLQDSRLSYALGIVSGLAKHVKDCQRREEEERRAELERARRLRESHQQRHKEAYEESDQEDDSNVGTHDDVNDDNDDSHQRMSGRNHAETGAAGSPNDDCSIHSSTTQVPTNDKDEDNNDDATRNLNEKKSVHELQQEEQALVTLDDQYEQAAKNVLKEHKIRLSKGRTYAKRVTRDKRAYAQGVEDSQQVDLNQRALREDPTQVHRRIKKEGVPKGRRSCQAK